MLIFVALLLSALNATGGSVAEPKNGNVTQEYRTHRYQPVSPTPRTAQMDDAKTYYKNAKIEPAELGDSYAYDNIFKHSAISPYSQSNEQLSPYSENLFTMSAGYKVANDNFAKPSKQSGTNVQVPIYKTNHPLSKGTHVFSSAYQNKKPTIYHLNPQEHPSYLSAFQSQPLVLNPLSQFQTGKVNNLQLSSPFASPLSSFQSHVVPISTASNNLQFPQYKGAAINVYPNFGGFSTATYHPLQAQPQLHFGHSNQRRPVENRPNEGILYDVEIITKKPMPPPKKDEEDDDGSDKEDDEGQTGEKEYGPDSDDDSDYEHKPEKHFESPAMEGDFKPSSNPFKQYDKKFGKYSSRDRDEETDEKTFPKYNDDNHDERAKYQSDGSSSKPLYDRRENNEENDETQESEETSDDTHKSKYFDYDEEFKPSRRNNFKYYKNSQDFQDTDGHSSDIVTSFSPKHEGSFGYKIRRNKGL
ncbi:formin-J-like [Ceratina calcarata]|uniref:Formin-J-like n=1 Tax=Ceratina calcarata TaxID=156304 RepID=A0AAJ7S2C5_9HYME|nr:formin-J-like [Ceratina calcarata]